MWVINESPTKLSPHTTQTTLIIDQTDDLMAYLLLLETFSTKKTDSR